MQIPPSETPSRQRRPVSRSMRVVFVLLIISLTLATSGVAMLVVSIPMLKQRREIARMMYMRGHTITLASQASSPERRAHLESCFFDPKIDLDSISWNLLSRPAPFVGYRPEPGLQDEGPINAQQMRAATELPLPKPADEYRIFMTGGSLAYGIGAPDIESRISDYMQAELQRRNFSPGKRVVVWNAAMPAWASTHERIMIENYISEWEPDMVVALTGGNDVHWANYGCNILDQRTWDEEMYFNLINHALQLGRIKPFENGPPFNSQQAYGLEPLEYRFLKNIRLSGLALEPFEVPLIVAIQPLGLPEYKPLTVGEQAWLDEIEKVENPDRVRFFAEGSRRLRLALHDTRQAGGLPDNLHPVEVHDVFADRDDAIFLDTMHIGDKGSKLLGERLAEEIDRLKQAGELGLKTQ